MALKNLCSAENKNDGLFVDTLADDGNTRIQEKEFATKIY
jgi:hypothetical protein